MRKRHNPSQAAAVVALSLFALAACGDDPSSSATDGPAATPTNGEESTAGSAATPPPSESGLETLTVPSPSLDADDFAAAVDNPYLPLVPGNRWVYRSTSSEGDERIVVTVTRRTRLIQGVTATVVRDTVTAQGELVEDTRDWYAQDTAGNVWYLGEATKAYDGDQVSTEGSWEAGVDGARAGIVMLADPQPGDAYAQEYLAGEAEDEGRVLAVDAAATAPYGGHYRGLVETPDTTPLEPGLVEHKYYAEGVGVVREETVRGGDERVVLIGFTQS